MDVLHHTVALRISKGYLVLQVLANAIKFHDEMAEIIDHIHMATTNLSEVIVKCENHLGASTTGTHADRQ
ncbi:MAG: hypothetical protein ACI9YO_001863 [Gammaproteobacteria bacterium]|jgi:hypothetical protein